MDLEQKIMAEMKDAMKSKNEAGLRGLRAIKAAIIIAKTAEGSKGALSEDDEVKMLQKLVKQRRESLQIYQQQNRPDLAKKRRKKLKLLKNSFQGSSLLMK